MILLRHGQSVFNKLFTETRKDPGIEDPELTALGHEQAKQAAAVLAAEPVTRVIVSPYTRALQTAAPLLAVHDVPVEVMHEVRERFAFACDVGRHPDLLTAQFPHHEFGHLPDRWWPEAVETAEQTIERAAAFRSMMRARDDQATTVLVSHWAFILALTGTSVTNGEVLHYDPHAEAPGVITWRP